jgi:tetratricopeptide (TPR) repeat protein
VKKIVLLILITVAVINLKAQPVNVDSLKKQLELKLPDSSRIRCLTRLGYYYQDSKPDSLLFYGEELLTFASRVDSIRAMSIAYSMFGQHDYVIGNYPQALQMLFKSLDLAESIKDSNRIANVNNLLGNTYKEYGDWREAILHFLQCKKIAESIHDYQNNVLFSCMNLGQSYTAIDILDSALLYEQQAYSIAIKNNAPWSGIVLNRLANIQTQLNNKSLALDYYKMAINDIIAKFGISRGLGTCYLDFANFYYKYGIIDSAIYYARQSLIVSKQIPYLRGISKTGKFLSAVYDSLHRTDSAYFYQKIYVAANDSLNSREKTASVENLTFLAQLREQEKEKNLEKEKEEREQNIEYALIALGIVIFIIIFLLLSRRVITNVKVIEFLSVIALLIVFEFLNLLLHPFLEKITHHTPLLMLLALVCIAALLIPLHHYLEKWATHKLVEKNKQIRLASAKKTIELLERN